MGAPPFLPQLRPQAAGPGPQVPSPSPAQDFAGLDDIADLSTGYRYIPPDTDGAVGLTKVMSGLNNNYRIFTKATGAVVSTVSPETFWGSLGGSDFFDPKTLYDPIRDRWIVVMLSDPETAAASINIGVSQTSDPSGSYYLYRVDSDAANLTWADFPSIGFDGDYVAVNVNMFRNSNDNYVSSKVLAIDYAAMRTGTWHAWFLTGSLYSSSPAATYTAAESSLYVPVHWNSSPEATVWTRLPETRRRRARLCRGCRKEPRVSWTEPGGNILPQKTGAGGGTPLKIDAQDSEIRSTPVVRDGFIYYAQTVGLPSGGLTAPPSCGPSSRRAPATSPTEASSTIPPPRPRTAVSGLPTPTSPRTSTGTSSWASRSSRPRSTRRPAMPCTQRAIPPGRCATPWSTRPARTSIRRPSLARATAGATTARPRSTLPTTPISGC